MDLTHRDNYQTILDQDGRALALGARSNRRFAYIDWSVIRNRTVLDIGCNNGMITREIARRGAKNVIGIEKKDYALMAKEICKPFGNSLIIQTDIEDYINDYEKVEKKFNLFVRFNVIFFCAMMNHIKDKVKMLNWIDRHCNGYFIYETSFEGDPEKHKKLITDYTSFPPPISVYRTGDRKPEDYYLMTFVRNLQELWGQYDDIPTKEFEINRFKIGVSRVEDFKGEQYKTVRAKIDSLKENIDRNGLIEPLHVIYNEKNDFLYIKEGGNRYLACKELKYKKIKARIIKIIKNDAQ